MLEHIFDFALVYTIATTILAVVMFFGLMFTDTLGVMHPVTDLQDWLKKPPETVGSLIAHAIFWLCPAGFIYNSVQKWLLRPLPFKISIESVKDEEQPMLQAYHTEYRRVGRSIEEVQVNDRGERVYSTSMQLQQPKVKGDTYGP